jgi:hypothetical protein
VTPSAGEGGWKDDLPLDTDLPEDLVLDLGPLREPIHPMFALRCRVFVDWHREAGRRVEVLPASDPRAREIVIALGVDQTAPAEELPDIILRASRLREFEDVEAVAERSREILEYQLRDVSRLGAAAFMAVSELCNNAVEHGANSLGAYIGVRRFTEPQPRVSIAISDLGIGIPEHLRQQRPELSDDSHAIGLATQPGVSGTGQQHRGHGFDAIFDTALTAAMHEARFTILSARGFFQERIVQEQHLPTVHPASQYRRGAWVSCELISA